MSTGYRVSLAQGRDVAEGLIGWLEPHVERIEVAGSIRRGSPDIGDVELVAVPRIDEVPDGMFATTRANRLTESIDKMLLAGLLRSHLTDPKRGERYSKVVHPASGLQVDLFSATPDTFGLIFLIRTGPADYSRRFVTDLRQRGLHVAEGQLHRGSLGCGSYVCEVIPTPEEADVYAAAGWSVVTPEWRA